MKELCSSCGKELSPTDNICPNCGQERQNQTHQSEQPEVDLAAKYEREYLNDYYGQGGQSGEVGNVRGWLLFFIITIFLTVGLTIVSVLKEFSEISYFPSLKPFAIADLACVIYFSVIGVYAAVALIKHAPNAIFLAKAYLAIALLYPVVIWIIFMNLGGSHNEFEWRDIVYSVVWWIFLESSTQVDEDYRYRESKKIDWILLGVGALIVGFFLYIAFSGQFN